ncbi:MAG: outer membrane beta-barrel family protein [Maribacter sp.]|uniref:outer membrane beta-barrel family protein n=1 Tax=Maribacter sp. TaxID=1897614 RepID=UPI003296F1FB
MQKLTLLFLFLLGTSAYTQHQHSISGKITDVQNQPIAVGDVLLFSRQNDTLLKYGSIVDGRFSLQNIAVGSYRLRISCLGFESVEEDLDLYKNIALTIQLTESAVDLDEVEIIAAKPIVTNENGNLRIDVTNPVFSSIPDPIELLARLPNLQISYDREAVAVIGKGTPLIYLGNQRISLEELNAISVDAISAIEIIKNPSVKYEADGRAVLLITLRISDTEGVKANLYETVSFRQNFNNYYSLNGSYKKKKMTLKANFGYNDLQTWESHQFEFGIPEAAVFTDYLVLIDPNKRTQINSGGGIFYQINSDDYFSANATVRLQTDEFTIDTDTFLRQELQIDNVITKTKNDNTKDFVSGNFNYNKKLSSNSNVFTGVQYSSFIQRLNTKISNNFNESGFERAQDREQKYRIDVLAYRFDLVGKFKNNMKFEFGSNFSYAKANAFTNILFFESNSMANTDFDYSEKNLAGYAQLSGNIGKKINFNAGLRLENNTVRGEVEAIDIPVVNRMNTNLFPKVMLNFQIDSTKNLTLNYSRSIERPNYSRASSISSFINPFLEGAGNVNLRPTFAEELSANFQVKNSSLSINYLRRKNPMFFTIGYKDNDDMAVLSLRNLQRESGIDIALTMPVSKGSYTSNNSVTLSSRRIEDKNTVSKSAKPYLYFFTDHQFKIGKDTTISFGGWALTKRVQGIFERNAMVVLNSTITKTFFDKLHCSLRFNDITGAMNFEERYSINGVNAEGVYFADAQELAFSMKYTFGKIKDPNYKNKDVDENLDRIQ